MSLLLIQVFEIQQMIIIKRNKTNYNDHLPTTDMFKQGSRWHDTVSFSFPTHGAISRLSFTFMEHFRFLDLIPSPQITEQLEKALQSPQFPPKNV
jgi:hypothetical protein